MVIDICIYQFVFKFFFDIENFCINYVILDDKFIVLNGKNVDVFIVFDCFGQILNIVVVLGGIW